jgi:hypothetical protein
VTSRFPIGSWERGQQACYVALRRAGWLVKPSTIGIGWWQAIRISDEATVAAKDFRKLLDAAHQKDAALREKQRKDAEKAKAVTP